MAQVINLVVGQTGSPEDGSTTYYSPAVAGRKIKVFREGVYQYGSGVNYKVTVSGSIIFIPFLSASERVTIIIQ